MKILYLCHRFPFPPKRGGKIRPYNMISHMHREHEVHVVSISRSKEEQNDGHGIAEHCSKYKSFRISNSIAWIKTVLFGCSIWPASFGYFHSFKMKTYIKKILDSTKYDLIFVHCSSVAQYVSWKRGIPKIIDFGDMDSQKWLEYSKFKNFPLSIIYKLEGIKLERLEKKLAAEFDYSCCTTYAEHETLTSYKAAKNTFWFPNGVDADYFHPQDQYDSKQICFIGRMDYYPNQEGMFWFCKKVWPLLLENDSEMKLIIVGANPSKKVRLLERIKNVEVTGEVPDVRPHVKNSVLSVAPLNIARGTQNKILESMAMGVPVICSPQAAGGIDAEENKHVLVANDPNEYVQLISKLSKDHSYRMKMSNAARNRILSHHNWEASMKKMDDLLSRCVNYCNAKSC